MGSVIINVINLDKFIRLCPWRQSQCNLHRNDEIYHLKKCPPPCPVISLEIRTERFPKLDCKLRGKNVMATVEAEKILCCIGCLKKTIVELPNQQRLWVLEQVFHCPLSTVQSLRQSCVTSMSTLPSGNHCFSVSS